MRNAVFILPLLVGLLLAGCNDNIEVGQSPDAKTEQKQPPIDSTPTQKPSADLAALEKASTAARAELAKAPKDPELIKKTSDTIYKEAEAVLVAPELAPKDKYPKALRLYREVVKMDPQNQGAKDSIQTIEDIYKSMGRPVPTG